MSKNDEPKREKLSTEPYKGVRDFYPEDQALLNYLTSTMREVAQRYGYVEYHASILEPAELYKSKGAENEEIVREQAYSFVDRGGREVTLRPEMTPTVARMVAAKRRELGFPLRLYSIPNVFRYERPQRGRLREHWQLNVDLFGSESAGADAEVIRTAYALMKAYGASAPDFVTGISSRAYLNELTTELGISPEKSRELLILLDRKAKMPATEFEREVEALGVNPAALAAARVPEDVAQVLALLEALGVPNARFDISVVRGFDYYTGIIFEITDTHPQNNRSMFGGGRYDNLTGLFDDERVPGVGFGMGDVSVRDFLEVRGLIPPYAPPTKVYIAIASADIAREAMKLAEELRAENVDVAVDFGDKKLGDQIKNAGKHKIPWLLVIGENELATGVFTVRNLDTGSEEHLSRGQLPAFFLNL